MVAVEPKGICQRFDRIHVELYDRSRFFNDTTSNLLIIIFKILAFDFQLQSTYTAFVQSENTPSPEASLTRRQIHEYLEIRIRFAWLVCSHRSGAILFGE